MIDASAQVRAISRDLPTSAEVVIIGGGVIGVTLAYYLTRRGIAPLVLDRGTIGRGASSANPGTISLITKRPGLTLSMARSSLEQFSILTREMLVDFEYERLGAVLVAQTDEEWEFLQSLTSAQRSSGVAVETVDASALRRICPLFEGHVVGASYHSADYQVNPFLFLMAMARAAIDGGAILLSNVGVDGIEVANNVVTRVVTRLGEVKTRWVINAAGIDADKVGGLVGRTHDVTPSRGQLAVLKVESAALPGVKITTAASVLAKHKPGVVSSYALSVTPKPVSRTVLVGVSRESVGVDSRATSDGISQIAQLALELTPSLAGRNVVRTWAGLRPARAKGPLIGNGGGPRGYLVAVGHGGDGVALAPVTANFLADVISTGEPDLPMADWLDIVH